jgi:LPXTG-site transpeptidase (sortase) family protein
MFWNRKPVSDSKKEYPHVSDESGSDTAEDLPVIRYLGYEFTYKVNPIVNKTAQKLREVAGVVLMFVGIFMFLFPNIYRITASAGNGYDLGKIKELISTITPVNQKSGTIGPQTAVVNKTEQDEIPMRIIIPALSVDLPTVEANIVDGYWETSDTAASHGVGSANPGTKGNIVIFAHARQGLFLPLRNISKNTRIFVFTKHTWYEYTVTATKLVTPDRIDTIGPTADETLTLYTCSGFFDAKRIIVTAKPVAI